MKVKYSVATWVMFLGITINSQSLENKKIIKPFADKLNEDRVTQILFLGDSHIQADWITSFLRIKFQEKYGNAGRGLVFPYTVANSNGPDDFTSSSNQTWENFRLVYEQDVFSKMGASGFVIGNNKDSFLEIKFKNLDETFDKVVIFNDEKMNGEEFKIFNEKESLNNFISKSSEKISYKSLSGDTFPELASKFYTTTTKLKMLNGSSIQNPTEGKVYTVEKVSINYNKDFENTIHLLGKYQFTGFLSTVNYSTPQNSFLMQTNASKGNIFYGFQFLKNVKKGVVFNTVGVNGATFADFMKFPLQMQQLATIQPDLVIIALGTNESISTITKEEFQKNVSSLIVECRKKNPELPILLISPTDNLLKKNQIKEIVSWIKESATQNNVSFFNLYEATGESGYFEKSLKNKEANADGVHFLRPGYEFQAGKIWKALSENL